MHGDEKSDANGPQEVRGDGWFNPEPGQMPKGFATKDTPELIKRAQEGDAAALNDLFTRYHNLILETARRQLGPRLRQKEDPDDLAQTTFREAARDFKRYEYRGDDSLLRWLIQILQNKIRDKAEYYSASKRDASLEVAMESTDPSSGDARRMDPIADELSVTRHVQLDERFELLRNSLEKLNPEYRQAIALVFFEGLSLREAGKRMGGRTEDALRMMLRRAETRLRESLRGSLGKEFRDSTSPPPSPPPPP